MQTEKKCAHCGDPFEPAHGNETYCSSTCSDEARKQRQKTRRDPVKVLIAKLMKNHEIIESIIQQGKAELNREEIEAFGLDLSLCRHLKPSPEHKGNLLLDFGEYYLTTELDFQTFKIYEHDTITTANPK